MEDCRYYEELIGAELDGELTDSEAEALHAHLETCETCRIKLPGIIPAVWACTITSITTGHPSAMNG